MDHLPYVRRSSLNEAQKCFPLRSILPFLLLVFAGCQEPQQSPPGEQPSQILEVVPETQHLGKVWRTHEHVHTLTVRNVTGNVVRVTKTSASCDCTAITPSEFVLAPGEEQLIELKIDLASSENYPPSLEERIKFDIRPEFSDGSSQRITINGVVLRPFTVHKSVFPFVKPFNPGGDSQELEIDLRAHPRLRSLRVETDDPLLSVVSTRLDPPATAAAIVLHRRADNRLGRFSSKITIRSETDHGDSQPPVTLTVVGEVDSGFDWEPRVLILNTAGTALSEEPVYISSRSTKPPQILSVECSDQRVLVRELSADEIKMSSGAVVAVSCRVDPRAEFDVLENAVVVIKLRAADAAEPLQISLPVSIVAMSSARPKQQEANK